MVINNSNSTPSVDPAISPTPAASAPLAGDATATTYDYAGFWRRLYANYIDSFIIGLISSSFMFLGGAYRDGNFSYIYFPGILISALYYVFFWVSQDGQTIGKRAMRVKVIRQDGRPLDISTAIVRYIGYLVSGAVLCLGYLAIAFNKKKLAWHDRIAKTYVITTGPARKGLIIILTLIPLLVTAVFAGVGVLGYKALRQSNNGDFQKLRQSIEREIDSNTQYYYESDYDIDSDSQLDYDESDYDSDYENYEYQ